MTTNEETVPNPTSPESTSPTIDRGKALQNVMSLEIFGRTFVTSAMTETPPKPPPFKQVLPMHYEIRTK